MKALWGAILVLCLAHLWLIGKIGGLIRDITKLQHDVKLSMAGKLLPVRDDEIARAPAAGMTTTPPPTSTAYEHYIRRNPKR